MFPIDDANATATRSTQGRSLRRHRSRLLEEFVAGRRGSDERRREWRFVECFDDAKMSRFSDAMCS